MTDAGDSAPLPPPPPPPPTGVPVAQQMPPPPPRGPVHPPPPPPGDHDAGGVPDPPSWSAAPPARPPEAPWSAPATRVPEPPAASGRGDRPPIYDPSHYGYGPWRPIDDDPEPIVLPGLEPQLTGWARFRGPLLGALVGALVAGAVAVGAIWATNDDGTVTTVFELPDAGASTVLEGEPLDIQAVLTKVQPSVVTIDTGAESFRGIFEGSGSGVVIGEAGLVLTNAHVIQGADTIEVTFFDGTVKEADLVGSFPDEDIAIVRARDISGLVPAELGNAETLRVGDDVVAIGNALDLGESPSVTKGIVSAKDRTISDGVLTLTDLIQTDAAINPGNSGGPLVNAAGQVVGINTAIIDNAQSIGFAISIDAVAPLIDLALTGDAEINPDTAFLGVTSISVSNLSDALRDQFGVLQDTGAFVQDVIGGSPAEDGGIGRGDVITAIDGQPVDSSQDVARIVRSLRPGDEVEVLVERAGALERVTVTLDVRN